MAVIESWFNQDLKKPVKVQYLDGNVFSMDNNGSLIGVNVFDGESPASLAGTVAANVIRSDGATVAVSGTLSGNKASVVLPQSALAVPGVISVVIKLTTSGVITTLCAVVSNVYQSSTDSTVDPGTIIPSIETLIAAIEAAIASIPADYSSLWTSLAPAYSSSSAYKVGSYCTYNGGLYRCIVGIASGETWTSGHWTQINVGGELKRDRDAQFDLLPYQFASKMQSIIDDWSVFDCGVISASTFWGMNKVYPAGYVDYVVQKVGVGGSLAQVLLISADGNNTYFVNQNYGTADAGYVIHKIGKYIPKPFWAFVYGRTCVYNDSSAPYKSRVYNQAEFTSGSQFAIGVVYNTDYCPVLDPSGDCNFIKSVSIFDDSYAQYAFSYVWKDSNAYKYYFRLLGSNDNGATWTNIDNIGTADGSVPTGKQTYTGSKFAVTVNWDETPATLSHSATVIIRDYNSPYTVAKVTAVEKIKADKSPFVVYNPALDYIIDIQVKNTEYKYYAISYTWLNSGGYYYYFRILASNDGTNWTNISNIEKATAPSTVPLVEVIQNSDIAIVVDWTLAPASVYDNTVKRIKTANAAGVDALMLADVLPVAGYVNKDEIRHVYILDCLGHGNFTTIEEAFAFINSQNPSISNQFELVVKPGRYSSLAIIVPPYTHMHGIYPDVVVITSEDYQGETTNPTLRQDFGSSKLSNLHIISATGYCIHYDQGLNGCMVVNDNLILEHKLQTNESIIGGGTFLYGTLFEWNNCVFINGNVPCHTNRHGYMNTKVVFNNCKFINSYLRCGSVGGYGDLVFEINNCLFKKSGYNLVGWQDDWATYTDPTLYFANTTEWIVSGHGNRNFMPYLVSNGTGLMIETKNVNEQISISGTAVPVLFGYAKIRKGNARIKGRAYGVYRVQDKKAGDVRGQEGIDVFQMWKRLGDCSSTNLTLTVTVGGTSKTYTFDQDYTSSKPTITTLCAAINAVITNATISAYTPDCWENIMTDEKSYVIADGNNGILKGEYVRVDGTVCQANDDAETVFGRALEDGVDGEIVQVWVGNKFAVSLSDGEYGIGSDGTLSASATEKIGDVENGVFYRK